MLDNCHSNFFDINKGPHPVNQLNKYYPWYSYIKDKINLACARLDLVQFSVKLFKNVNILIQLLSLLFWFLCFFFVFLNLLCLDYFRIICFTKCLNVEFWIGFLREIVQYIEAFLDASLFFIHITGNEESNNSFFYFFTTL